MNDGIWKIIRLLATLAMLVGIGIMSWLHEWTKVNMTLSMVAETILVVFGAAMYLISELFSEL